MKAEQFNRQFVIDANPKRGLRAKAKGSADFPDVQTADGEPYSAETKYFYFDESGRVARSTESLRRIDADWLGSLGFKVVQICKLRADRNDALSDGQKYFKSQVSELEKLIESFESEKVDKK